MTSVPGLVVRLALLTLGGVLLQTAAVSQVGLFGAVPDLAPLIVASVGLLCVIGHVAGRLRETARDPDATFLPLPAGAAATAVHAIGFSMLYFLLGVEAPVSVELVRQVIATVLINTLLALPVHAVVRRVLAPALGAAGPRPRRVRPGLSPLQQA